MAAGQNSEKIRRRRQPGGSRYVPAELEDYQKVWDAQLPKDPMAGAVVVVVTLMFFACFMCFPWIMSFMQDEGWIKPKIELGIRAPQPIVREHQQAPRDLDYEQARPQRRAQSGVEAFGRPRQ